MATSGLTGWGILVVEGEGVMSDEVGTALVCSMLGFGFVGLSVLFAWLLVHSSRAEKARIAQWREFAAERRGTVNADGSGMTIERDGCRVQVARYYDRGRKQRVTTIAAPVLGERAPRFFVLGQELGSLEGPRHGLVRMAVTMAGGPEQNEPGTEARWSPRARSAMTNKFKRGWVQSDGMTITLSLDGTVELLRIDEGIDLVAGLAAGERTSGVGGSARARDQRGGSSA